MNWWEILGVSRYASYGEVKHAYNYFKKFYKNILDYNTNNNIGDVNSLISLSNSLCKIENAWKIFNEEYQEDFSNIKSK